MKDLHKTILVLAVAVVIYSGVVAANWLQFDSTRRIVEKRGLITNIETCWNNSAHTNHYTIYFDDNTSYNIAYTYRDKFIDLTNSHVIIVLEWTNFWLTPNVDDVWGIETVIKYGEH